MLTIKKTSIQLTKGDTAYIQLNIMSSDGNPYTVSDGDHIKIQVRKSANGGELLFEGRVEVVDDMLTWHIYPEDTKDKDIGVYVYDAQIELSNGDIFTFIPESSFSITNEVTE